MYAIRRSIHSREYWGNVNSIGPRGVYDEAKRYAEAMAMAYHRTHGISVKIARIFNTYGPRMRRDDGRAVPTFVEQALEGEPITVHGDGSQTRSLCYVDDLVEGIWRLLTSDVVGMPVNLGNPEEVKVLDLARTIVLLAGADPKWSSRSGPSTIRRSAARTSLERPHCSAGCRASR